MKKYMVIYSRSAEGFAAEVEALLAKGWALQGGVSVAYDPDPREVQPIIYAQALWRWQ